MVDKPTFFKEAVLCIASDTDTDKAMSRFFAYIQKFIPLSAMSWHLFDADAAELSLRKARSVAQDNYISKRVKLPHKALQQIKRLHSQGSLYIEGTNNDPLGSTITEAMSDLIGHTEKSLFLTHEKIGDQDLGHICYFADGPSQFQNHHLELIKSVARPTFLAAANKLRFWELEKLKDRLVEEKDLLSEELQRYTDQKIIGSDTSLREIMDSVKQLARVKSPVLIIGETGVGKELVANAIQKTSRRGSAPYIKVNCAAIPNSLMDSELFGHEKGAFTGATDSRKGYFERANGGTLFLDEICELSLDAQARLLRVLQYGEVQPVGSDRSITVDVRFIAATHRKLSQMVQEGQFREDLFYRVNVFPITVPPLHHRKEDISALTSHFIEKKSKEMKLGSIAKVAPEMMHLLAEYEWPGNIRELENLVERALIIYPQGPLKFDNLLGPNLCQPQETLTSGIEDFLSIDEAMRNHIKQALALSNGKIHGPGGAAQILQINPSTLRKRMDNLGIRYGVKAGKKPNRSNSNLIGPTLNR